MLKKFYGIAIHCKCVLDNLTSASILSKHPPLCWCMSIKPWLPHKCVCICVSRETSPHSFQLDLFFNNVTKPNNHVFNRLGRSEWCSLSPFDILSPQASLLCQYFLVKPPNCLRCEVCLTWRTSRGSIWALFPEARLSTPTQIQASLFLCWQTGLSRNSTPPTVSKKLRGEIDD